MSSQKKKKLSESLRGLETSMPHLSCPWSRYTSYHGSILTLANSLISSTIKVNNHNVSRIQNIGGNYFTPILINPKLTKMLFCDFLWSIFVGLILTSETHILK